MPASRRRLGSGRRRARSRAHWLRSHAAIHLPVRTALKRWSRQLADGDARRARLHRTADVLRESVARRAFARLRGAHDAAAARRAYGASYESMRLELHRVDAELAAARAAAAAAAADGGGDGDETASDVLSPPLLTSLTPAAQADVAAAAASQRRRMLTPRSSSAPPIFFSEGEDWGASFSPAFDRSDVNAAAAAAAAAAAVSEASFRTASEASFQTASEAAGELEATRAELATLRAELQSERQKLLRLSRRQPPPAPEVAAAARLRAAGLSPSPARRPPAVEATPSRRVSLGSAPNSPAEPAWLASAADRLSTTPRQTFTLAASAAEAAAAGDGGGGGGGGGGRRRRHD